MSLIQLHTNFFSKKTENFHFNPSILKTCHGKSMIFLSQWPNCQIESDFIQSQKPFNLINSLLFTGVFKAPFMGVYFFTFSYHADKHHKSGLQLMKNNEVIVQAFDDQTGASSFDNAGNSAVLQLQEGDQVSVCLPVGCSVWGSSRSTSFTGFLVY